jgi:hypothetical protein
MQAVNHLPKNRTLTASALPTVLVACVLLSLLVLFAINLFGWDALFYARYHNGKQQRADMNSLFVYYCNDSTLSAAGDSLIAGQLYEDDSETDFRLYVRPWGLYERVTATMNEGAQHSIRMIGKQVEEVHAAALWVCSRETSLAFAGSTTIEGKAYVPHAGINYLQFNDTPFSGIPLERGSIALSTRELPAVDTIAVHRMDELLQTQGMEDVVYLSGNKLLLDTIITARKIVVEDGFVGASLQLVASDTVIIGEGAELRYPSGVYLHGNKGKTFLQLGNNAHLSGYAIVFGEGEDAPFTSSLEARCHYRQDSTTRFRGLLYVDGIAHIEGQVSGAVYVREAHYLPPNGIYAGVLYNASIRRDSDIAYPLFFKNAPYRRSELK